MIKTLILLIISIISTIDLHAQSDSTLSFVAYWNKGDLKKYRITKKQIQIRNGNKTKDQITEYNITCSVLDSTDESYTMEWEYENAILKEIDIPTKFADEIEKYRLMNVIYQTDEFGIVEEIINWKEIRDLMYELLEKIPYFFPEDESANYRNALKPLKDLYATEEAVSALLLKEIQVFHLPMGMLLSIEDTTYYEENLPNLLGGDPIKANGKIYFQSYDTVNFECTLINTLKLDSADSKRMVVSFINNILSKTQYKSKEEKEKAIEELNNEFSNMSLNIEDYNTFEYLYYPGWPNKINTKRITKIDSKKEKAERIDEIIIERL